MKSLADKLIQLRKQHGWSQEELAEKLSVSRQAVSKWESAQAVPDIANLLQLSTLFGVTTDYLLKDEGQANNVPASPTERTAQTVCEEQARAYIALRRRASRLIALATLLCILSPLPLILLGACSEYPAFGISETAAGVAGLITLFVFVLCAVPLFLYCGFQHAPYAFLEDGTPFLLEASARRYAEEQERQSAKRYTACNILATCLCIIAPIPLIVSAFFEHLLLCVTMLCVTVAVVGIGVVIFIVQGVPHAAVQRLLQKGEFTPKAKRENAVKEAVEGVYWCLIVGIYLAWSFLSGWWHITWVVFPLGGVLSPLLSLLFRPKDTQ